MVPGRTARARAPSQAERSARTSGPRERVDAALRESGLLCHSWSGASWHAQTLNPLLRAFGSQRARAPPGCVQRGARLRAVQCSAVRPRADGPGGVCKF